MRPLSRDTDSVTIDQGAGPCRSKAHGPSSHPQPLAQEADRAGVRRRRDFNGLAREHDLSRNLIRIWVAKSESGESRS